MSTYREGRLLLTYHYFVSSTRKERAQRYKWIIKRLKEIREGITGDEDVVEFNAMKWQILLWDAFGVYLHPSRKGKGNWTTLDYYLTLKDEYNKLMRKYESFY